MGTSLATYYAKLLDMPDSEYKVEILEDGPIKKIAVNGKIYEVDYNMGGDSIHSIIIDHHSHGVQISPSSNNSYTIMNKGELYQIELQGEMEKIHNARAGTEAVGRQGGTGADAGGDPENIREEGRRSQAWRPALRIGGHENGKRDSFCYRRSGERSLCRRRYEGRFERPDYGD